MTKWDLARATQTFKALAHPARLRILAMLEQQELCVCQLTALLSLAPSTVSAHLAALRRAGLIRERKDGRWVRYGWEAGAEPRRLTRRVVRQLAGDAQVELDARLRDELLAVPLERLCRAQMKPERLGIRVGTGRRRAGCASARTGRATARRGA